MPRLNICPNCGNLFASDLGTQGGAFPFCSYTCRRAVERQPSFTKPITPWQPPKLNRKNGKDRNTQS